MPAVMSIEIIIHGAVSHGRKISYYDPFLIRMFAVIISVGRQTLCLSHFEGSIVNTHSFGNGDNRQWYSDNSGNVIGWVWKYSDRNKLSSALFLRNYCYCRLRHMLRQMRKLGDYEERSLHFGRSFLTSSSNFGLHIFYSLVIYWGFTEL